MSDSQFQDDLSARAVELYFSSDSGKKSEQTLLKRESAKASGPLLWIACTTSILPVFLFLVLNPAMQAGNGVAWQMVLGTAGVAGAFWVLWIWSTTNPLPAAVVGLLLYLSMLEAMAAIQDSHPNGARPPVFGPISIVNLAFLARAIWNGSRQRRTEIAYSLAVDGVPGKMPGGIASGIWLYITLLFIILMPPTRAPDGTVIFWTIFLSYFMMAVIIGTWAICAWRDTLPAYRAMAEGRWYGFAILVALASSMFASVYLEIMRLVFGVQSLDMAGPFLEHGYGWLTVVGCIAIFPAIFEEMAFRGVIVPCFKRVLSEKETIAVTGIMFMVLHLSVFSAPHLLFLGCMLAYVRLKSGSIWPCVVMHFSHNAMCLVLEHFFK